MLAFDLEYDEIGAALGGGWDMTRGAWRSRTFSAGSLSPTGATSSRNICAAAARISARQGLYARPAQLSVMSLYEVSAIVRGESFRARDLLRGSEPVVISERTATRTLAEWDRIAARIVAHGQKRVLSGGLLAFPFEASERLMAEFQPAAGRSGQAARSGQKQPIADDALRAMAPLFTATWLTEVLPKALGFSRPTAQNSDGDPVVFHEVPPRGDCQPPSRE